MRRRLPFLILLLALHACAQQIAHSQAADKRVLFIGNSLTAAYNIPALVEALSALNGRVKIASDAILIPGTNLEDQWNDGHAVNAIRGSHWDVVVLQQGPTSRLADRGNLVQYAKRFAREARTAGGVPAFYMVWPASNELDHFPSIASAFRAAAKETSGIFIPAGNAWKLLLEKDAKAGLYSEDGFHPSARGAVLSALVIHNVICGCSLDRLPRKLVFPDGTTIEIENPQALIQAADAAIAEAAAKEHK